MGHRYKLPNKHVRLRDNIDFLIGIDSEPVVQLIVFIMGVAPPRNAEAISRTEAAVAILLISLLHTIMALVFSNSLRRTGFNNRVLNSITTLEQNRVDNRISNSTTLLRQNGIDRFSNAIKMYKTFKKLFKPL